MADDIDDDLKWLIGDDDDEKDAETKTHEETTDRASINHRKSDDNRAVTGSYETDDEDDGLTDEERALLERNTLLNDASDREEYDLKDKVEKANADLERIRDTDSSRETKVMFKKNLIDVEAQPPDYSSDSSSSSSSSDSEDDTKTETPKLEIKEETSHQSDSDHDEDVLIEKGGKFKWMSDEPSIEADLYSNRETDMAAAPKQVIPSRPRSAPAKSSAKLSNGNGRQRPSSASRSNEYSHIKSPYAMSSEMKELMRKRQAARASREEEERAQARAKEEQDRKNSEEAWKAWVERKDQEVTERKKKQQEEEKKNELNYDPKQEADEAYQLWLKEKRKQRKKDRMQEQQRQLEVDEGWYRRDRKECDQAYKRWLRQKHKEARIQKASNKKQIQRTRADIYRMRQLQRLIMSIRSSQKH